ncbi:MAG: NADH-quinone oxidoreductase subunit NuoH [Planctomycetes bacterium]|nr:NADH-quinone oxidoreductase subunit NuoH [Planctomycetota bacterium]
MHDFNLFYALATIVGVFAVIMGTCAMLIFIERKVAAWVQDRLGPNRVGPAGLLQSVADGLKFLLKEDIIPRQVDKVLFLMAPAIAMCTALLAFAVVPFGATSVPPERPDLMVIPVSGPVIDPMNDPNVARLVTKFADYDRRTAQYRESYQFVIAPGLDIGIVFVFAITSLAVYAIILGGWAANNKYSFIGGLRSSAQFVSYEIPLGLSILGVVLMTGSLNLEKIIWDQTGGGWNIFVQPLAWLIFVTAGLAECNRVPFDLPEAEQELVGGYHTEYSAMKFAMFFLGEYTHLVTTSFLNVIVFFGGWHFPFIATAESGWLIKLLVIAVKVACFILFFMVVRWTLPRFRFDQLMALAWKVLIPLAIANLICVMIVKQLGWSVWILGPVSIGILIGAAWLSVQPMRVEKASAAM